MKSERVFTRKQMLIVLLCSGFVLGCGCPMLPMLEAEDVIALATEQARLLDPNAIVFQVSGDNDYCPCAFITQTRTYTFLATDVGSNGETYRLTYDGTSWTSTTYAFPPLGAGYYDLRQITLSELGARTMLCQNGHGEDFDQWTLYRPLYPSSLEARYVFYYSDKIVTIDAKSREITVLDNVEPIAAEEPLAGAFGAGGASLPMLAQADAQIKETARSAFIIWGGGRLRTGAPLDDPNDTEVWDFIAIALNGGAVPAWQLTYDEGWTVQNLEFAPLGVTFIDLSAGVSMDIVQAWQLALDAGYSPPISVWELFQPLNPSVENPLYVFATPSGFVIVDTVTGEVSLEANCCDTDACYGHCND